MEQYQSTYELKYISLFSGIGGFELGIQKIFPNAICLGYSEINSSAIQVYEKHFPNHPALDDIREINGKKFRGKVDLLVGGSPCQNFSAAGDRKGLKGKKSSLFYEYIRLLKEIKPKYFILENVKMKKMDENKISKLLRTEPVLINSNIISLQRRNRLYWCNFDISKVSTLDNMEGCVKDILLDRNDERLKDSVWRDLRKQDNMTDKKMKDLVSGKKDKDMYLRTIYQKDNCSPTIMTMSVSQFYIVYDKNNIRTIHPTELERLQTFPDNWTKGLPKTKRGFVLGNAVTCDVIALLVSNLVDKF